MDTVEGLSIIRGQKRTITFQPLHRIIEHRIERGAGEKIAIIIDDAQNGNRNISYNTFNTDANRLAQYILQCVADKQVGPNRDGDWIICVCMTPCVELLITLLAIWKTGAAYLPIDPAFPANRIEHILTETNPVLVIYDDSNIDCDHFAQTVDAVGYAVCQRQMQIYPSSNIAPNQTLTDEKNIDLLGLVLYTSGSTGVPKGVRLSHSTILNRLQWQWETFPYSPTEDAGVFKTSLTFVDSVAEIWGPLLTDLAIIVVPREVTKDPNRLITVLQKYEIERLVLVPTLLKSLLMYLSQQKEASLLRKLRIWVCSGEILSISLANEFYEYFAETEHILCNFYGSTEVMGDVTCFVCENKKQLKPYVNVPIGCPIFNTEIQILDSNQMPVLVGQTGEIYVSGLNLANGYVNGCDKDGFIKNPLAVDPKFGRLYRTGDYASLDKNGIIQYEGRTDSQIKLRGHRVNLIEIEKQLLSIQHVEKGVVLCNSANQILAFVTIKAESHAHQPIRFEKILRTKLVDYMVPQVTVIEKLPLLVNGKIDRQSLLKMCEDRKVKDFDYSGVMICDYEKCRILFETIAEVVGYSTQTTLSLHSNFYEIGGNSLNSLFTVLKLRSNGYFIAIDQFISAINLREILNRMTESEIEFDQMQLAPKRKESQIEMRAVPLAQRYKADTIEVIAKSFVDKGELEQPLKPHIQYSDYDHLINAIWETIITGAYSFIVKDGNDRTIGAAINYDINNEPNVTPIGGISIISNFAEFLEAPFKKRLPKDKPTLYSFLMGTAAHLSPQENVIVMSFMENETLKVAKKRGCDGVLATNCSPLTRQLAENVLGYETILDYQVNQYTVDGYRPFGKAPDHHRAVLQYKKL